MSIPTSLAHRLVATPIAEEVSIAA